MTAAPRIAVVGTGPVARALAAAHVRGGGEVAVVVSRSATRADETARRVGAVRGSTDLASALEAPVTLVAVPDRALPRLGTAFAAIPASAPGLLLHTSGALAGAVLGGGAHRTGSLHPLQSFPDVEDLGVLAARVAGTHFFHEGEGAEESRRCVARWRGTMHALRPGAKALYHAGAAVLSNHTVALFDTALSLLERAGLSRDEARAPLASLLRGTVTNLETVGVPAALTGPVARGDVDTVRVHLDALAAAAPELLDSYVALALRALVVARARGGIAAADADALDRLLREPPASTAGSG